MKTLKIFIIFVLFIISLYYSKDTTLLGPNIWLFLYGSNTIDSFYFILSNLIYLIFICLYFNLLNINLKLSKFIITRLYFYHFFIILINLFYDFYYYLFKIIQPIQVFLRMKFTNSQLIFNILAKYTKSNNYFKFKLSNYASFLKSDLSDLIFGIDLKNYDYSLSERKFIANLIKKAYSHSIMINSSNKIYKLTLAEAIELFYRIEFKLTSNNSKLLKNFIKLLKLLRETQDVFVYSDLVGFDRWKEFYGYEDLPKKKVRKLFLEDHSTANKESNYRIKKFLKLMKYNPIKYRLFVLLCLNNYFTKIKSFLDKDQLIISIDFNILTYKSYYSDYFCTIEYNLYYLYKKELNFNKLYYKRLLNRFFKEMKIMFQFIKYFILFYFITFIINPIFINYFLIIFIISSFILQYLTLKTYNQFQLLKYKIIRIIYFKFCYSFHLLILTNALSLILINYLILTLILILLFSLFETFYHTLKDDSDDTTRKLVEYLIKEIIHYNPISLYFVKRINKLKQFNYKYYFKAVTKYHSYKVLLIKFFKKN